ncbi:MAG: hypothetical protein ACXV2D_01835, partial [Halobacteriota archaeon]
IIVPLCYAVAYYSAKDSVCVEGALIEKKCSKPTITYPLIRLPRELAKVIGSSASIYQTRYEDSPAFVVVLDDKEAGL